MEDIKKVLQLNKVKLMSSSDDYDSESDCYSLASYQQKNCFSSEICEIKCSVPKATRKRNVEKRLPTRKPDPNVYNRNALLARENRKKKKIYLETIEKELYEVRKENRALVKALRMQLEIGKSLEKEKKYYENLVKSSLNKSSPVNELVSHRWQETDYNSLSVDTTDFIESGPSSPKDAGKLRADISDDLYETAESLSVAPTTWDDIWGDKDYNNDISTNLTILQNSLDMQILNEDHCYAKYPSDDEIGDSRCYIHPENCNIYTTFHSPPCQLFNT